jgi:hypothetical protein
MEFDIEASCSASSKRGAVSGKSSISCYLLRLGRTGTIKSMVFSGLSNKPASSFALVVRLLLSILFSEPLELSSPSRTIGLLIQCQRNRLSISTTKGK